MFIWIIVTLIAAGIVFLVGEYIRRRVGADNEVSRKLVHAIHGLSVGFWPFVIGYKWTIVLEILFLLSVLSARKLHWFRWLHKVGRQSWGDFLYPLGIIVAALTAQSKWIYLAAALELGLADAAAALAGKQYGQHNGYKILGQVKSVAGSAAFFAVSCLVLGSIVGLSPLDLHGVAVVTVLGLSVILAITENIGVYGTDNFLLPIVTVLTLNLLS